MKYLILRNGWYHYSRHVPVYLKEFDIREKVRTSLNTKCPQTALKRAVMFNDQVENDWQNLIKTQSVHKKQDFKNLVVASKQLGFRYIPSIKLAEEEIKEIISRLLFIDKTNHNEIVTNALLGKEQPKKLLLSKALEKYWDYSKPDLLNKNLNQQRKWKNPRKKAVNNFIKIVDDKEISRVTNLDLVMFRDWWLNRMKTEQIKADTVNKDFTHLKSVIETVSTHEEIEMDIDKIFKKIHLKETDKQTRKAYSTEFIRDNILNPETLKDLDKEAQNILFVCMNTGARPIEVVNLIQEDIILDDPIPYIHIRPRQGYSLKTKQSERKLPLVGLALEALKAYPKGFNNYRENSEKVSADINSWLSKHNLRPTKKHSLYSFRHSFQDRLTALDVKDRVQCQLMGHKFNRPKYGNGASLEQQEQIMNKVSFCYREISCN